MLPTKLQTLKLHFFLKDEAGRKNSNVTPGEITSKVTEVIKHYWSLAGYETLSSPKNKISKLIQDYQYQHKKRNMTNKKSLEDRKKFEDDDKSRIAVRLLQLPKPKEMNKGLPTFPKLSEKTELRDLVTSESWELFNILKLDSDWLALPPAKWDTNPDYIEFRKFVRSVKVTNDCAEGSQASYGLQQVPHQGQPGEEQDLPGRGGGEEGQARRKEEHSEQMILYDFLCI